ncbi:MAG: hypothetical protein JWL85_516 [Candidatus Saccharibacteria bacterium]|nr:hypothetical protein [Candidatus Saccharibacteria bacterium]
MEIQGELGYLTEAEYDATGLSSPVRLRNINLGGLVDDIVLQAERFGADLRGDRPVVRDPVKAGSPEVEGFIQRIGVVNAMVEQVLEHYSSMPTR